MNRFSMQPISYASIDDLRRALLIQIRRFNKACGEFAAGPARVISLTDTVSDDRLPPKKLDLKKADVDLERIELLRSQIQLLNNMSGQLLTQFGTEEKSKELRDQVEDLRNEIMVKMNSLQRTISEEAKGKVDNIVRRRARDLQHELIADYKLKENQVPVQFYISSICVNSPTPNVAAEVFCIRIVNLEDSEHNRQPNFYVTVAFSREFIISQKDVNAPKANKKLSPMYLAVSPQFRIPAKVRWDLPIGNVKDLQKSVKSLLEREGIIGVSEKREIPIPKENINFDHENILGKHSVKGNLIEIHVADKDQIEETAKALLLQLNSMVRAVNPRNRDLIKMQVLEKQGIIRFLFTLPGKMRGRIMSPETLQEIKRRLYLTDAEILRVKTALEDHEQN